MRAPAPLVRAAHWAERMAVRLLTRSSPGGPPVLEPYIGFAGPEHLVLRGRVLTALRRSATRPEHGRLTNLRQMIRLFLTDEVSGVLIEARGVQARSDDEGYFTLRVPRQDDPPGWASVPAHLPEAHGDAAPEGVPTMLTAFVPEAEARFGVISDIDDTIMETGAWRPVRMAWTSLTGNTLTRRIFPDAVRLMAVLSDEGRNPVFYVSSSPWNLHDFLIRVFLRHGLADGPLFLRDFGISKTGFIADDHGTHKSSAIDEILSATPDLPFVLVGDTGQQDAAIYASVVRRHPGRVARVVLRVPDKGTDAADEVHVRVIRDNDIPVNIGRDFSEALGALEPSGGQA